MAATLNYFFLSISQQCLMGHGDGQVNSVCMKIMNVTAYFFVSNYKHATVRSFETNKYNEGRMC